MELAKLEVKKLLKFPGNEVFDRVGKSVETEVDLSTGTTTTTEKKNPFEDLSSIYDSCYAIALKHILEE